MSNFLKIINSKNFIEAKTTEVKNTRTANETVFIQQKKFNSSIKLVEKFQLKEIHNEDNYNISNSLFAQ